MSLTLIATDEAGYGPKLGPLVIAGSAWTIPCEFDQPRDPVFWESIFAGLRTPLVVRGGDVVVDDSKAVYQPSKGIDGLHAVTSAAIAWTGQRPTGLDDWLSKLCPADWPHIANTPWLADRGKQAFEPDYESRKMVTHWNRTGLQLNDLQSRIITAPQFNDRCRSGCNKADVLSESTLGLVHRLVNRQEGNAGQILVYCDRHGGRRYYGGVLQHCFPDYTLRVIDEARQQSRYQLENGSTEIEICFTVKGDSFPPVALSSMIAKYLRERMMNAINRFFAARWTGVNPFRPTAGYPVDADRFLLDVEPILVSEQIATDHFVRCR